MRTGTSRRANLKKLTKLLFGQSGVLDDLFEQWALDVAGVHRHGRHDFAGTWARIIAVTASLVDDGKSSSPERAVDIACCACGQAADHAGAGRLTKTPSDTSP